jgi:UDP-N-acetylglucosamine 2-epimerase (non-hydrolysing)
MVKAMRRYVSSRVTGRPLKRMAQESRSVERTHQPLGDLLLERRVIAPAELREALSTQEFRGGARLALGEILLEMSVMTQEELAATLALQAGSKVRRRETVEAELAERPLAVASDLMEEGVREAPAVRELPAHSMLEPVRPFQRPVLYETPQWLQVPVPLRSHVSEARDETPSSAPDSGARFEVGSGHRPQLTASRPAMVIPISGPHRSAKGSAVPNARRFTVLHQAVSKWKTPFPARRILVAIGSRTEAMKLAPLVRELRARIGTPGGPEQVFVGTTGQHREMVDETLASFGTEIDSDLNVMEPQQTLTEMSAKMLSGFARVIAEFRPDWVVVQGETATTSMAGLAAFYAGVRVAHVEAGMGMRELRRHPLPEEFNRRMVGMFAEVHFAATDCAKSNLLREGVDARQIIVTGDTGIDALHINCERLGLQPGRPAAGGHAGPVRVLVTANRRENLEEGIAKICGAIANVLERHPGQYVFLWPLHPNARVGAIARERLGHHEDVLLTGPAKCDDLLGYLDVCDLVLTDSGALQEEAPTFGKPVLILGERTDRPEGVHAGLAWLVGCGQEGIAAALEQLGQQIGENRSLRMAFNPYGDGCASGRIADFFGGRPVREFGEAEELDEMPRRMPVMAREYGRMQMGS